MKLTFENFMEVIDPEILSRGKSYYAAGNVHDLEEVEEGHWEAEVIGSEVYEVGISDEDGALATWCDCPYEWGEYCKHIAAVLYAIQAQRSKLKSARKAKKKAQETVRDALENLTQEQLITIVLEQVKKDKSLGNQLLLRYGTTEPDKSLYVRSIKDALKNGVGRDGYIDYRGAMVAASGINAILEEAKSLIEDAKYSRALKIIQAVLETVPEEMNGADDSSGELGGTISYAFNILEDMAETIPPGQKQMLFDYCLLESSKWRYQGFDYDTEFLAITASMVTNQHERESLFAILDRYISPPRLGRASRQQSDYMSSYQLESMLEIKVSVMEQMGDPPGDILDYLLEHIHLHRVRQRVIQTYKQQQDYAEARKLCEEGIRQAGDERLPGLVQQYKALLLEIAQLDAGSDAVIPLAEELFLDTHQFEHYDLLKRHIPPAEWLKYIQGLIQKVQKSHSSFWGTPHFLGEIYVREGMWPQLLALAQDNGVTTVQRFKEHLYQRYPTEVCAIYEKSVFEMLKSTTGRGVYQSAVELLNRMVELGQRDNVKNIIQSLKVEYPNRRAMREELDQVML